MTDVLRDLADDALEALVLPSFSRLGYEARRRLDRWRAAPPDALAGRTVLITGPTSGLGRVAAFELARLGARLLLVGRNEAKLEALRSALSEATDADRTDADRTDADRTDADRTDADRFRIVVVDMTSLGSAREAARAVMHTEQRLDVVVDNAGAIYPDRQETEDGIERTLAILVCGPYVMERELLPLLRSTPGSRVIAVTSGGMYAQRVHFDDLQWRSRTFNGPAAYAQAKRIQVALVREWALRTRGWDISFNAMHPGWADTPGLADALPQFQRLMRPLLRSPQQGADTITWLATTQLRPPGGRLYLDRRPRLFDRVPQTRLDADDRAELWETIAELTGVPAELDD